MAKAANLTDGARELRQARATGWPLFLSVGVFSAVVNLLMLTGPLFMLQVYDRVLASRSVETLTALFVLVIFLFVLMGAIDIIRNRVMQRIAARFQDRMEGRVFDAALREGALRGDESAATAGGMRDLDSVQRLIGSPVMLAFFDLPWAPLFLAAVFMFHPVLGIVATVGGGILVGTTILNRVLTRAPLQGSAQAGAQAQRMADLYRDEGEVIGALGMRGATFARWRLARSESQDNAVRAGDLSAGFSVFSRTFRLFLQSAMLAAGAWLVLRQELTPGAMIASSIVMGRALAPVDQLVGGWPSVQAAQDGWGRLAGLLSRQPPDPVRTPLPRPEARLEVRNLSVAPPGEGQATLRGVSFGVAPGTALGVIGPSGAGKSTLARALIGAWRVGGGSIRLGGATLDQYHPDVLGGLIGYLPQQVTLFDGTIAENIARLSDRPDPDQVVRAAQAAAAHQMILDLPQGYDTRISQTAGRLSGGQIQRIGLARALYPDPVLLVLDEPNSNLDNLGSEALNAAIRRLKSQGGAVIIMAHRPAAINECENLLVLEGGVRRAFGPRDKVLEQMVQNSAQIRQAQTSGQGGGVA
ncbi:MULTISPECIES: type I secretion system permease/ATPase [unclassified Paracoccus (in: a-proteobacteria)]|uniref:type I secretion system permease/ATPase n=1 Tax=unclassified Paracoccus (in: a-proteobacteria) TaxID=2688777 RepID=UPI0005E7F187|nr:MULTISPECIES: type I secretion system permease/ATPase [unclassified Paracoccus (in: a-proteobacteria)]KIX17785.1 peptide ABC transporter ATPase [Paracoccus sp. 228]KIX18098.1 peptide ABC transporter ATPase [Paracoccus sp. 228]MBF5079448.1 type I secretion system permease/ATPase [Paracoccus sp. NBH48]